MDRFSEAFAAVVDLALALGADPLHRHPGCWECRVDGSWHVAVNGHPDPRRSAAGDEVRPFSAVVTFGGWPAAVLSPAGGVFVAGTAASEGGFIAAVRARLAREKGVPGGS